MIEAIDNLRLAILHVEDRRAELDRACNEKYEADTRLKRVQRELDEALSARERALEQYSEAVKAAHPWLPVNKMTDGSNDAAWRGLSGPFPEGPLSKLQEQKP